MRDRPFADRVRPRDHGDEQLEHGAVGRRGRVGHHRRRAHRRRGVCPRAAPVSPIRADAHRHGRGVVAGGLGRVQRRCSLQRRSRQRMDRGGWLRLGDPRLPVRLADRALGSRPGHRARGPGARRVHADRSARRPLPDALARGPSADAGCPRERLPARRQASRRFVRRRPARAVREALTILDLPRRRRRCSRRVASGQSAAADPAHARSRSLDRRRRRGCSSNGVRHRRAGGRSPARRCSPRTCSWTIDAAAAGARRRRS